MIEVVFDGMPGGVVQIDQVDRGDAGADEWDVIVFDRGQRVREARTIAELSGRRPGSRTSFSIAVK